MADYDEVILPGKEGKIEVIIKGNRIHPGFNKKSFTVTTNDPENGRVLLFVSARVKRVFDAPSNLTLAGFVGEETKIEAVFTNVLDEPVRITGYRWDEGGRDVDEFRDKVEVEIEEIDRGRKYRLIMKKTEEVEPGRYTGRLVLTTDFAELREKKVVVTLAVNPIVDVRPEKILFGEIGIREGEENVFEKKFHIVAMRGDSLRVLSVSPSRDDIEVDIRELHPGRVYEGMVKVKPTRSEMNYTATIRIFTNYPGHEELDIAVQGSFVVVPGGE